MRGLATTSNAGASRSFVFGSALDNSNSQWGMASQNETVAAAMPSALGNVLGGDEARTGFAQASDDFPANANTNQASAKEKKKSVFAMLHANNAELDWEKKQKDNDGKILNLLK